MVIVGPLQGSSMVIARKVTTTDNQFFVKYIFVLFVAFSFSFLSACQFFCFFRTVEGKQLHEW